MLTKEQKSAQIEEGKKMLENSKSLIFIDFSGTPVEMMKKLRNSLRESGSKLKVIKKKLLRIIFEKSGVDFNPEQFEAHLGVIFTEKEVTEVAVPVYKFSKEADKTAFKILGGYDLVAKDFYDGQKIKFIGQLPPREILLAQFIGMLSMPIKMFMNVLNEKSKMVEAENK